MHPILAQPGRLGLYLAAWIPATALLATLVTLRGDLPALGAALLVVPLGMAYAVICLASWYPCRALAPGRVGLLQIVLAQGLAAVLSSTLWLLFGSGWALLLSRIPRFAGVAAAFRREYALFLLVGILLYLLAASGHYLLMTFQASREAEHRALALQMRARGAELEAYLVRGQRELAERELELARSIQRRLLPPPEIETDAYRVAARNLAAQIVAGDFYDVFPLSDGSLGVVVADVAGKGMGASLIMASVKAMLPLVAADRPVVETLARLNDKLSAELAPREFVALAFARCHPRSGRVEIANAGLPDPYLLPPDGPPAAIEVPGPRLPLGTRKAVEYESREILLRDGDRLLLFTDGMPEARTPGGDPLGYDALPALLDHVAPEPGAWLDGLLERLRAVTAEAQEDDITLLLVERRPFPAL